MAVATKTVKADPELVDQLISQYGGIPDFHHLDCKPIGCGRFRINVWIDSAAGELGFLRVGRISQSFIVDEAGAVLKF